MTGTRRTRPRSGSRSTASERRTPGAAPTPLDVAARLLTTAPRTEADLEARLVRLGYRPETAAATVARCRELGWVGDDRYAEDRARALRARGAGSLRIAADLTARGLPERLVEHAVALSLGDEPERAWAARLLARQGVADLASRARAWRLLARQGYPEEVIYDLLGDAE